MFVVEFSPSKPEARKRPAARRAGGDTQRLPAHFTVAGDRVQGGRRLRHCGRFRVLRGACRDSIPLLGTCMHSWIGAVRSPDRPPAFGGQPVVRRTPSQARHVKMIDAAVTLAHILRAAPDPATSYAFGALRIRPAPVRVCSPADGPPVVCALSGGSARRREARWRVNRQGCGLRLRRTVGSRRAGVKDADGPAGGSFDEVEKASVVVGLKGSAQKTAKRDRSRIKRFEDNGQHLSSGPTGKQGGGEGERQIQRGHYASRTNRLWRARGVCVDSRIRNSVLSWI